MSHAKKAKKLLQSVFKSNATLYTDEVVRFLDDAPLLEDVKFEYDWEFQHLVFGVRNGTTVNFLFTDGSVLLNEDRVKDLKVAPFTVKVKRNV